MSTRDESKDFAKGGIITGPTMPLVADCCCCHECERIVPVNAPGVIVDVKDMSEDIARAIGQRVAELAKRGQSCA